MIEKKISLRLRVSNNDAAWIEDAYRSAYPLADSVLTRKQLYGTQLPGQQVAGWLENKLRRIKEEIQTQPYTCAACSSILEKIALANEVTLVVDSTSEDLFSLMRSLE